MAVYVIGDVQGCYRSLMALTQKIESQDDKAKYWFAGDLVNRGPDSLAVLRYVKSLGKRAKTVLGNHDLHLLAVYCGIRPAKALDTVDDILNAPDADELIDWLRRQPLALSGKDHLLVHAGVCPSWSAKKTLKLAGEVEDVLSGSDWKSFIAHLYGNKPDRWDDSLEGHDRLRAIINILTRMRFCTEKGRLDFENKTDVPEEGYMPWFDVPDRKTKKTPIVFGHWSTMGLVNRKNLIGLDTGCVWDGELTAVRLKDRKFFSVASLDGISPF